MNKLQKAVLGLVLILASCTSAKMSVSEELKMSQDEYPVKGRNGTRVKQKMSFGDYGTTGIKRSWVKGGGGRVGISDGAPGQEDWQNIISVDYIHKKQTIRFQLKQGENNSDVFCVSRFNAKQLEIGNPNSILNISMDLFGIAGKSSSTYYVQVFASSTDELPWEMLIDNELSQAKPKKYIGYLAKSATEYYSIVPITKLETSKGTGSVLAGSVGFEFRNPAGKAVAAVSMLGNGTVLIGCKNPQERFLMANACAALLLQDTIG